MKKKFLDLFIVRREGLEHKWWHRLAKVLICLSTIVVAVYIIMLIVWQYKFIESEIQPVIPGLPNFAEMSPQKLTSGAVEFVQKEQMQGRSMTDIVSTLNSWGITLNADGTTSYRYITNYRAHTEELKYILIGLVTVITWFIIWESIVYRAVIYVVYGKGNKV